jgi:hypothetical protein
MRLEDFLLGIFLASAVNFLIAIGNVWAISYENYEFIRIKPHNQAQVDFLNLLEEKNVDVC